MVKVSLGRGKESGLSDGSGLPLQGVLRGVPDAAQGAVKHQRGEAATE
jgi:hypothetical protein